MNENTLTDQVIIRAEKRLRRERQTIRVMIEMYCDQQHHSDQLCGECQGLLAYAMFRIDKCPFKNNKPTCAKCPIHCYKPEMRAKVREVMRFSGPKMIFSHPVLAVLHILDGMTTKR